MSIWKVIFGIIAFFFMSFKGEGRTFHLSPLHLLEGRNKQLLDRTNVFFFTDSRGYVWISSVAGLNRYDGLQIEHFTQLRGRNIQSDFFEDTRSNIWFCTDQAVHCYDRLKGEIRALPPLISQKENPIQSDYQIITYIPGTDQLWVVANDELHTINVRNRSSRFWCMMTNGLRYSLQQRGDTTTIVGGYYISSGILLRQFIGHRLVRKLDHFKIRDELPILSTLPLASRYFLLFSPQGMLRFDPHLNQASSVFPLPAIAGAPWRNGILINTGKPGVWFWKNEGQY